MEADKPYEVPSFARYYLVFFVILALMVTTFGLSFVPLGMWNLVLAMMIAVTQAILLSTIFMHLNHGDKITWMTVVTSLVFMVILFVFILTDYLTRHIAAL